MEIPALGGALLWDASMGKLITGTMGVGQSLLPFFESITSPATNFMVAFACGLAGTLYFALFGRDLGHTR